MADFTKWVKTNFEVENFRHVEGPDHYYEAGANVVRHRIDPDGRHELTVKRRTSGSSTRDRLEVDLHFSDKTQPGDVTAFLGAAGFTKSFTLVKDSYIWWVKLTPNLQATFVIYDSWLVNENAPMYRRFIEAEAEKKSDVTHDTAKRHIRALVKRLQERFDLGEPLNDSLYEIYSGRKYKVLSL